MPIRNRQRKILPGTRGYTLVEMMMVILILGIVSSLSVPPLFRYVASHRLQTNTDRMAADMLYARSMSISSSQVVNLSNNESGYKLTNVTTGDVLREVVFDDGLTMDTNNSVMFYPWGMADDAIFSLSGDAGTYDISLLPTGIVEVTIQ